MSFVATDIQLARQLPHILAARTRIENLWAAGTDYTRNLVQDARLHNRMLHLDLDLTGECELKCFYCDRTSDRYSDMPDRLELRTAERLDLIAQAHALGATTVEFPGAGEPMVDPDFWQIVASAHQHGMTPVVFTSGYHLDGEAVERLFQLGATVFVKHNSHDAAVQDKMVGVQGYGAKANAALQRLLERGFNRSVPTRVAIDVVVTPQFNETGDFAEVCALHRWCRLNNVHNYIVPLIPEGRADRSSVLIERERADRMINEIRKIDEEEFGLSYHPCRPMTGGYRCRQVNVGLFVNLFGEVYDCNGLGRFLGHTKCDGLKAIWNATFARHIRKPEQDGFCLLRERVWDTVASSGLERKLEFYRHFESSHGGDEVVKRGLERATTTEGSAPRSDGTIIGSS
ncbi:MULTISPECIES: radical SAM protein [unclassified Bradyrhizobium]|uniref:radical SAM protein n=1 Tax=Bradyrhizobium sp. USDA 4541 TaxID=2817704 RepID=UPI0020A529F6|nr:radical SAM protein [Bradyrhizobium sp. USDA 4541]MCP1846765.1 MoaA/NifB/PqqE/SkfB family radical SAM enzyme [Bradyrhizobium sp. USDA 4541]